MQKFFLIALLCFFGLLVQGCSTPEGGSSLPWAQPESWETGRTTLGTPY